MKRGNVILLVLVLAAGVGIFMMASVLHNGLSARATPSALEAMFARHARQLAFPASAKSMANPVPTTAETLRDARQHFADHCAICHGNDGSGDTMMGRGLYPKPPDLRLAETQNLTDGQLFWVIENGVRFTGMPAFLTPGAENDSWKLVAFIRHLPKLTEEERMEMEQYNPKGPGDRQEEQQEDDFLNGGAAPKADSHQH
ncbi:MAG TPA: c-type cytochrome [Candidatus Acidoferrum sp.]|nr:c-type cytochrome [Candidatus Acidoferrum sp.]